MGAGVRYLFEIAGAALVLTLAVFGVIEVAQRIGWL